MSERVHVHGYMHGDSEPVLFACYMCMSTCMSECVSVDVSFNGFSW